jgi:hypothetical protein
VIASAWWYGLTPVLVVFAFFVGVVRARRKGQL